MRKATDAPTRDGSEVETEYAVESGCSNPRVSDVGFSDFHGMYTQQSWSVVRSVKNVFVSVIVNIIITNTHVSAVVLVGVAMGVLLLLSL